MTWRRQAEDSTQDPREVRAWIIEAYSREGRWWGVYLLNAYISLYWWPGTVMEVRC